MIEFTETNIKQHNILIVDDLKFLNDSIAQSLKEFNQIVDQAYTLSEAKNLIAKKSYDYILLDLELADGNGKEIIENVNDEIKSTIIVLSASSDKPTLDYLITADILDYISKEMGYHNIIESIKNSIITRDKNSYINILIVDDDKTTTLFMSTIHLGIKKVMMY